MKTPLIIFIISVLLLNLSGCGIAPKKKPTTPAIMHPAPIIKSQPKPKKVALCGYRTIRGLAVVQKIQSSKTFFNFYPGDWRVVMTKDETNKALKGKDLTLGSEIKAELKEPVSGPCTKIKLLFIPPI